MSTANTTYSDLHIRLDANIKTKAEGILSDLGIAPSSAVNMFYRQVIAHDGLPFQVVRRANPVPDMDAMTTAEINSRLERAEGEIAQGKFRPVEDAFRDILGEKHARV